MFDDAAHKLSRDEFVEGKTVTIEIVDKKRLMTGIGQLKERDAKYKNLAFFLHNDFQAWIDDNAKGNRLVILNELIRRGIEAVEKEGDHIEIWGEDFDGFSRK